jgi:hypothetical protein
MKKRYVLGLLAVFVAFASVGSQCQKVTDPAGSSLAEYSNPAYAPPFSPSDFADEPTCQAACNRYYNGLKADEMEEHKEIMDDLQGNDPEIQQMRKEELERHHEALREIQDARQQCVRDCHDQGGVSGGF